MKIKEENNRMREDNQRMAADIQKKDEALKNGEKVFIHDVVDHINSLPGLESIVKTHRLRINDEKKLHEFLTLLSNLHQVPARSSQQVMPPRTPVGTGNQMFTASQILTRNSQQALIQNLEITSQFEKQEIPDISTYTDTQGIPHHQTNSISK